MAEPPFYLQTFITMVGFCMGFCMYGAIGLIGTIAVEVAPIHMTGASHGILGVAANRKLPMAGLRAKVRSHWIRWCMLIHARC